MRTLVTLTLALVACGNSQPPAQNAQTQPTATATATGDDAFAACVSLFEKGASCSDEYLAVIVNARVKHDVPPGIAEKGKTDDGKKALLAEAKTEFKTDASEPKRSETCKQVVANVPPAELAKGRDLIKSCVSKSDCKEFASCVAPMEEEHIASQKK